MEKELLEAFFRGEKGFGAIGMQNLALPLSDSPRRAEPLTAYHVLSTLPKRDREPGKAFLLEEFEVLTAKLSALCWRRYNGPIYLVTDPVGAEYVRRTGLDALYDGVQVLLSENNWNIPIQKFWACSKILALRQLPLPCVILDMDLIVWEPLPLGEGSLAAGHIEHIRPQVYPPLSEFWVSPRYRFPDWDEHAEPLNTSILYMKDRNLRDYYTRCAIDFMQYERYTPDNGVRCMVFAEQRILAMCAAKMGITAQTFLDYDHLDSPQTLITHTWSGKRLLRFEPEAAERFKNLCEHKLKSLDHQKTREEVL